MLNGSARASAFGPLLNANPDQSDTVTCSSNVTSSVGSDTSTRADTISGRMLSSFMTSNGGVDSGMKNASNGGRIAGGDTAGVLTGLSCVADMKLPATSRTAPCSMSSSGAAMAFTLSAWVAFRVNVMESVAVAVIMAFDSVTPPEDWLVFRMWILEASWAVVSRASLNDIFRVAVAYVA